MMLQGNAGKLTLMPRCSALKLDSCGQKNEDNEDNEKRYDGNSTQFGHIMCLLFRRDACVGIPSIQTYGTYEETLRRHFKNQDVHFNCLILCSPAEHMRPCILSLADGSLSVCNDRRRLSVVGVRQQLDLD